VAHLRITVFTDYRYARARGAIWAERAFAVFLNELARHHELTVVGREGTHDDGVAPRYRLASGVRFCALPFYESLTRAGSGLRTLPRAVRRFNRASADADIVWILGPNPVAQAFVFAALARRVPVVLGVRQDLPAVVAARYPGRRAFLAAAMAMELAWRLSAKRCPCVVVGPQIADAYRASRRLHVLTVSLMRKQDITSGPAARSESGRELLSVGRLEPEKDPLLLADVLACLRDDGEPWRLRVCGEGPLREALETRLRQYGLDGAVWFEGYVRHGVELLDHYRHADALVITSRSEGLPQTVVEAFAAGLPVVSSDVGGIRAAFGAAVATVPPGDARAAAACLRRLHGDPEGRQRMADAGRIVARNHTLEAEAGQVGEFLVASARRWRESTPSNDATPAAP
jgi:glycosyltransferase involved in cell wall biosynthesis